MKTQVRRGFAMVDFIMAITIGLAVLVTLASTIGRVQRAEQQLSQQRAAQRRLEASMGAMQSGGAADPDLRLERLPATAPAGYAWVKLSAGPDRGKSPETLTGLVPAKAAVEGGRP